MEKISRILPPSARTQSYDSSRAMPARPGAPEAGRPTSSVGRPESMDVIEDRMTISDRLVTPIENGDTIAPSKTVSTLGDTYKSKDVVKTQKIKEMTDKFFSPSLKEVTGSTGETQTEELASRAQSSTASMVKPDSSRELTR
jgi:hypothetical protein